MKTSNVLAPLALCAGFVLTTGCTPEERLQLFSGLPGTVEEVRKDRENERRVQACQRLADPQLQLECLNAVE